MHEPQKAGLTDKAQSMILLQNCRKKTLADNPQHSCPISPATSHAKKNNARMMLPMASFSTCLTWRPHQIHTQGFSFKKIPPAGLN
jgi:hypothetical protein